MLNVKNPLADFKIKRAGSKFSLLVASEAKREALEVAYFFRFSERLFDVLNGAIPLADFAHVWTALRPPFFTGAHLILSARGVASFRGRTVSERPFNTSLF